MNYLIRISSVSFAAMLILSAFLSFGLTAAADKGVVFDEEIIRLHVIANSDSRSDQVLKLKVRDAVLEAAHEDFENKTEITSAKAAVEKNLDKIKSAAEQTVNALGYDYDIEVQWGIFDFPVKTYGNMTFPAGKYRGVRVIIGEGKGQNWWCVMFPPLCFVNETTAYVPKESADEIIKNPEYKIKFKIEEMIK